MSTDGIGAYYERLGRWNAVARALGYGGGRSTLTVHRALADPRARGRTTHTRLHDLIRQHVTPPAGSIRVLDAGCGLGGTMLYFATHAGATCVGVTLSASQAARANAAAAQRGVATRVRALVGSYDDPPAGPFDLVIAIESLAHSPDPERSVAALARVLAPGGEIAIVDDMPHPEAHDDPDLARFKAGWQCPVLCSLRDYRAALQRHGLAIVRDVDLSGGCRPRPFRRVAQLIWLNRAVHAVSPAAVRRVMDSHLGGLALERLIRGGRIEYRLLVARRPEVQVS